MCNIQFKGCSLFQWHSFCIPIWFYDDMTRQSITISSSNLVYGQMRLIDHKDDPDFLTSARVLWRSAPPKWNRNSGEGQP
ncbi:hypothetical protein Moror_10220 [Moniliophthora roreri MCA 2997]|uniref:Uncharacterized protein n=1 Tax=Moniliophthora roreri (strain MCA 2997) TaxID=1381753 RepID=V2XY34_MONRO|nr:hypothetical protein Moror_10220 [Moniliophthora roreri MCA 2997]